MNIGDTDQRKISEEELAWEQNENDRKRLQARSADVQASYRRVFGTDDGQIVLRDLMKRSNMLSSSFDVNTNVTLFREGERNVVLQILSILKVDPAGLDQKMSEVQKEVEVYGI